MKKLQLFLYSKSMANFEPLRWNFSLSINLLFLKSGKGCLWNFNDSARTIFYLSFPSSCWLVVKIWLCLLGQSLNSFLSPIVWIIFYFHIHDLRSIFRVWETILHTILVLSGSLDTWINLPRFYPPRFYVSW